MLQNQADDLPSGYDDSTEVTSARGEEERNTNTKELRGHIDEKM